MEDLFHSYWWLLFPLAWFIGGGWTSWLNYRARRDALKLIPTYADKGQEPPAELLRVINRRDGFDAMFDEDEPKEGKSSSTNWGWYQVALFGGLGVGLGWLSTTNVLGDEGLADAFLIAAVVMGALT